jgi:hypothetical protein
MLAWVSGPEYWQPMVNVPAPGIPVTENWLEPRGIEVTPLEFVVGPAVGMVTLAAVMANGVAASAETPQNAQQAIRSNRKE